MPSPHLAFLVCLIGVPTLCSAQGNPSARPPAQPASQSAAGSLPVRRVVLYKTGVGYFEHLGRVRGNDDVTIRFTSGQLNDVLKSLTTLDLGRGRITGISYNSMAPLSQRLGALRLPIEQHASLLDLLQALRGTRIEVASGAAMSTGRLLGVERRTRAVGTGTAEVDHLSMISDAGEVRTFEVTPALRVRVLEGDLRREIGQYLDLVGSTREQDVRRMVIQTAGTGERDLLVSYVSEVPVWKSTYRLVLPREAGKPLLQGWAIVDNTIGEDWTNVSLSLVAGAPQSFVQEISQPLYTQRPVVPMPRNLLLTPQTHQATLTSGSGVLRGVVRDQAGQALPGVRVVLRGGPREVSGTTGASGEYSVEAPAGLYRIEFQLPGFRTSAYDGVTLGGGIERQQDVTMTLGALSETVSVAADSLERRASRNRAVPGGVVGGVVGGVPAPPPPPAAPMPSVEPAAQAADLGDLFEYRLKEPVTIGRNQSALVPIVSAEVEAEKVSLWSRSSGSGRPLRAVWLTNNSGLTLDGGSFAVVEDGAFAGEGLVEPLQPGERRLISYAADLAVLVSARQGQQSGRLVRLRARDGIIIRQTEERAAWTYSLRNEDSAPRLVVIEHPVRPGWKLGPGAKPAESSPGAHRFRVTVDPRKEQALDVQEVRLGDSSIQITEVSDEQIVSWRQSGIDAAALEKALRPVIEKKAEMARHQRRLDQLEAQQKTIVADQQRLRENMKALRGSDEERQLLRRYTTQLDQQEDQLAALERDISAATAARDKAREELSAIVGGLSFDLESGA